MTLLIIHIADCRPGRINLVQQTFYRRKQPVSFLKFSHYSFSTISTLRTLIKTLIFFWQTFCLSTKRRHAWCRWHGSCV